MPMLAQENRPNIVVILADDLGYGDVGFNGCPDIPTPNIDAVAANGVLCTNAYVTHPFCSPSRAGLITGRYQQRFGYENQPEGDAVYDDNPRLGLPTQELLLPQIVKPAGYVCGAIGKWHLGLVQNLDPIARGFDEFYGFLGAASHYYNANLLRDRTPVVETEYLTDAFTREGVAFINNHASQPFLLYLAYNAVHKPYDEPPSVYMQRVSYITDPKRRLLAAMVVALDDGVGQVVQALAANNILNNTLIIFLSDNGAPDTGFTSNYPLRGYKMDVLDGGIRVPFAVQWTDRLPAHVVYDNLVSSLDIVPTAGAAAGVALPTDRAYDGLNIVPYLAGEQPSPLRTLFWRWFGLGLDCPSDARNTIWAVRSGPLKLVVERAKDDQPPALYNMVNDVGETQDLAAIRGNSVRNLTQLYAQWTLDTIPPIWEKNINSPFLPLVLAGDWNRFDKNDSNPPWSVTDISAPDLQGTPDGFNWLTNTIHVATTGGDATPGEHSFVLVSDKSYAQQWGGVTINIDNTTTVPFYQGHGLGPMNTISLQEGYYSFRIIHRPDQIGIDMQLAVMKTSAPPVSVGRVGQTPANPTPHDPIIVSIATSQVKSAEERIYVRWSTDSFITSHLIEAQGSGMSYSATIPPQPRGTLVLYTIVTSTADLTAYSTSGEIDSLILATTGVFNAVPPIPPSITTQPSDETVPIGQTATFRISATGSPQLQYQWRKNGENIPGATSSSYTTPPTVEGDNGSLFSVVVSNSVATAISNNATLILLSPP
ncbi:MAG TPA: sulfatase-like hydrolase/transferase [Candidatus Udaeobacter sp.]|nr:sulfatase-like hydrolase/transferase [Candidatus Udaeobacter sp.]